MTFSIYIPSKLLATIALPAEWQWGRTYKLQCPKENWTFIGSTCFSCPAFTLHLPCQLYRGDISWAISLLVWNKAISVTFIVISDSMPTSQLNTGPQGLPYIPIQLWLILKMFRRNVGKKVVRYIHWSFRSEIFSPTEPEQESFSTQKLWKSVAEEIILKGR